MNNKKYITQIKNGEIIFWFSLIMPLFLWSFFLYKFFDYSDKVINFNNHHNSATSSMLIFFALFPFLFVLKTMINIFYNEKRSAFPWSACLSTENIPKKLKENGVIATYDYECEEIQQNLIHSTINSLVNRFYYINYGLFLLVIMIYNNTKKQIFNDKMLANWSLICLFLGILGTTLVTLDDFLFISIMFIRFGATLLTMMNASFGIVLIRLINVFF